MTSRETRRPLSPTSDRALDLWERRNEIRSDDEPDLTVRAKTQTVSEGLVRYMGETFTAPERFALGMVGAGEVEQVIDPDRPIAWQQNAPGPKEADRGARALHGSRESGDPGIVVGEQKVRQQIGAEEATDLQPQIDTTRERGQPGGSALSTEQQTEEGGTPMKRKKIKRAIEELADLIEDLADLIDKDDDDEEEAEPRGGRERRRRRRERGTATPY